MSNKKKIAIACSVILVAIQLIPVDRSNPPARGALSASPEVMQILQRACYDCHSNQVEWPWYGYVAPFSLLLEHDVEEAREHLNFSNWSEYSAEDQAHIREEAYEFAEEGVMPPWFYTPLHPEAELSETDLAILREWAK